MAKLKAFIYTRTSGTAGKQNAGYGAKAQLKDCRDYCKANKLEIVGEWYDNGVSGAEFQKSYQLMDMLENLEKAEVIVSKSSCRLFGREQMRILLTKRAIKKSGRKVVFTDTPGFDLYSEDPHDFLINNLMEVLDQWERLTISSKLAKGRYNRHIGGRKSSGRYPLGYMKTVDKETVVNPKTAHIVKWLYKEYDPKNRRKSLNGLSKRVEEEHGIKLSPSGIRSILLNKFYIGYVKHGREAMVEGKHEPLVSKNLFTRVNKKLLKNLG